MAAGLPSAAETTFKEVVRESKSRMKQKLSVREKLIDPTAGLKGIEKILTDLHEDPLLGPYLMLIASIISLLLSLYFYFQISG